MFPFMTTHPIEPNIETIETPWERRWWPSLCWTAIIGGTVAAIGIHILLTLLGGGAGLATFSPMTDADPVAHFDIGAAIIWTVCALISLWFGGLLAGRFSHSLHAGFVHGVLVWSLTLIITLLLISKGTGMVLGGGLKVLVQGLAIGGQAAASGAGNLAKDGVQRTGEQLGSFTDEAVQSIPTNSASKAFIRAKREVGFSVAKLFAPENESDFSANRVAVIKTLQDYTQMSEADATTTVDGWIASYKNLQAELNRAKAAAEQKAKESADRAARNLSCVAIWSFFAMLIGLVVTALGGSCGAKYAVRHLEKR
jgi:hypothetical protein